MPRKAKRSRKRLSCSISNLKPHALSQVQSTLVDVPLQLLESAQPYAPTVTLTPLSIPAAQNLVSASDPQLNSMPHKMKCSNKRVCNGTPNSVSHDSSQEHSTPIKLPLQSPKVLQPSAPTVTIIPPSIPTSQNPVSPSSPSLQTLHPKGKLSKKRLKFGITNSMSHASSEGHSVPVEPPLNPSDWAPVAPTGTLIPPSISVAQNPNPSLPSPSDTVPRKAKYSNKRVRGIPNSILQVLSQEHSTPMDSQLKTSKKAQPSAPATFIPPTTPTTQNLVPSSDSLSSMPCKPKLSRERASLGISDLVLYASSQGHSTHVEPPLQSSQVAQHHASIITAIHTTQNLVPTSDPPLRTRARKAKHSRERTSLGITNFVACASSQGHSTHLEPPLQASQVAQHAPTITTTTENLVLTSNQPLHARPRKAKHSRERASLCTTNFMPYASSQGHSTRMEAPVHPSQVAQSSAPTLTHIPASVPTTQNPILPSENLMHHASYQECTVPVESSQQPSTQHSAPTVTDIPPSIPTAEDLLSPSDLPPFLKPKSKHLKRRVSNGISSLMPRTTSEEHSIPVEPPLQPPEVAQPCAPVVTPIPPSIPIAEESDSESDDSDPSSHNTSDSDTYFPPSTRTRKILSNRPYGGRQWPVKAIDEHGRSQKIEVSKAGVFGMPPGQRIVVPFDRQLRAYGEAATLLAGACGHIVTNPENIPINFNSWRKVPKSYKDHCFNILKTLFHFEASESVARRYCLLTMSRKYKNGKLNLRTHAFDPSDPLKALRVRARDRVPAQRDAFGKVILTPDNKHFIPRHDGTVALTNVIRGHFHGSWKEWAAIPDTVIQLWWDKWLESVTFAPEHEDKMKLAFAKVGRTRLSDMLGRARRGGEDGKTPTRPQWIGETAWAGLLFEWAKPEYEEVRERNKRNRSSDRGGVLHTTGSRAHADIARQMEELYGRPINPDELFFVTHRRRMGTGDWIDQRSRETAEEYQRRLNEVEATTSKPLNFDSRMKLWMDVVGGRHHGRLYGIASLASNVQRGSMSMTHAFSSTSPSSSLVDSEVARLRAEIEEMRARMADYDQMKTRMDQFDRMMADLQRGQQGGWFVASHQPQYDARLDNHSVSKEEDQPQLHQRRRHRRCQRSQQKLHHQHPQSHQQPSHP